MKDIVQVGYCALYSMLLTLDKKYDELNKRFSKSFLSRASDFAKQYIIPENNLQTLLSGYFNGSLQNGTSNDFKCIQLSDSGIFGGLWILAETLGIGVKINISDILVRQETIEILEYFNANPYTYPSYGTYVLAVDSGHKLAGFLNDNGIPAALIGTEIPANERIVVNGDETRFLTPVDRLFKDEQDFNINGISLRKELQ